MMQVKNRAPAAVQVTAEQLVRAAREHAKDDENKLDKLAVSTKVTDSEELKLHQADKRKEFEDKLRHTQVNVRAYVRYAKWEESQLEFRRARSVYERALRGEGGDPLLWAQYAEFELRNQFVNHARNVFDRAVQHLPRQSVLWYKYAHAEEALGAVDRARLVFERWMQWHPEEKAWLAFAAFEQRHGEAGRARDVYERLCASWAVARSYLKYARWEEGQGQLLLARRVYERALEELDRAESLRGGQVLVAFARFEERCKEPERARAIYRQALELLPREQGRDAFEAYATFERQHGDRAGVELVALAKRRAQCEERVAAAPQDLDAWLELTRLEEAAAQAEAAAAALAVAADAEAERREAQAQDAALAQAASRTVREARARVRAAYDRAVLAVPPTAGGKDALWRRYVYLWINYALFEELQCGDAAAAREVYRRCLAAVPHQLFSFSKLWVLAAQLELRQRDLPAARRLLGQSIGRCPRHKVFKAYIQLELQLGNVDRCRVLYQKYLEFAPFDCFVWQRYAELERAVGETARARAIFEVAVQQPQLDMPEQLWKRYIDFELGLGSKKGRDNARRLYERLLERTQHVKVWLSFARFEAAEDAAAGRKVFARAYDHVKAAQQGEVDLHGKEARALVLQAWLEAELKAGADSDEARRLHALQPQKVKRRREVEGGGWQEYVDFLFPDDPKKGLKLLQIAQKWKASEEQGPHKKLKADLDAPHAPAPAPVRDTNEIDLDGV